MKSVNKATLIGNVGAHPEIRATSTGARVAKVSLATGRKWSDRSGKEQEKTEWHRLTVFGRLVDVVEQYVKKGDRLYVEGRIEYSSTESDQGTKYWTDIVVAELVMLGSGKGEQREDDLPPVTQNARAGGSGADEDLPFMRAH